MPFLIKSSFVFFIEIKRVTLYCDFQVFVQILGPGANLIFKLCSYILRLKWSLNFFPVLIWSLIWSPKLVRDDFGLL